MGQDFTNYQIFAGDSHVQFRAHLIKTLNKLFRDHDYDANDCSWSDVLTKFSNKEIDRSVAIGPPGRWITVYDSLQSDMEGLEDDEKHSDEYWACVAESLGGKQSVLQLKSEFHLSLLSSVCAIIVVEMGDSSHLSFALYENGEHRDTISENGDYGIADWSKFLKTGKTKRDFENAWKEMDAYAQLEKVTAAFGMNAEEVARGFTIDRDGVPQFSIPHNFELKSFVLSQKKHL